jgi:hypothetical protein
VDVAQETERVRMRARKAPKHGRRALTAAACSFYLLPPLLSFVALGFAAAFVIVNLQDLRARGLLPTDFPLLEVVIPSSVGVGVLLVVVIYALSRRLLRCCLASASRVQVHDASGVAGASGARDGGSAGMHGGGGGGDDDDDDDDGSSDEEMSEHLWMPSAGARVSMATRNVLSSTAARDRRRGGGRGTSNESSSEMMMKTMIVPLQDVEEGGDEEDDEGVEEAEEESEEEEVAEVAEVVEAQEEANGPRRGSLLSTRAHDWLSDLEEHEEVQGHEEQGIAIGSTDDALVVETMESPH